MGRIYENAPGNIASTLRGGRGTSHHLAQALIATNSAPSQAFGNSQGWGTSSVHADQWSDTDDPGMRRRVEPHDMESYTSMAVPDWGHDSQEAWLANTRQPYDYPTYQEGGSSGSGQAQTTL